MKFIFGNFRSGKSSYIQKQITNNLRNETSCWLIVPSRKHKDELFFQIVSEMGGLIGSPILTLSEFKQKLIEYIFPSPNSRPQALSNFEQFLIISRIIQENNSKFLSLKNISNRSDIIKMIYRLIHSLRDKDISTLKDIIGLEDRICDLELILSSYTKLLESKNLCDSKSEIDKICTQLFQTSPFFLPKHIYIDGFVDFTASQFKLLSQFCVFAENHGSTVIISLLETAHPISQETIRHFLEVFPNAEITKLDTRCHLTDAFLENKPLPVSVDLEITEIQGYGIYKEIEEITNQIKKLILFENYQLNDILLITNRQDTYAPIITGMFRKSKIPFIFGKDDILAQNPLIQFIKKCLNFMQEELSHEHIEFFSYSNYIKPELRQILTKASELMPIAVKGYKTAWTEAFIKYFQNNKNNIEFPKEAIQKLQNTIIELCDKLFTVYPHQLETFHTHIENLLNLLDFLGVEECLKKEQKLSSQQYILEESLAKDYSALLKFKEIMLDCKKSLRNIETEKLSLNDFIFFFQTTTEETRYRHDIPRKNIIRILSSEDARGLSAKAVFILGLNEGDYPSPPRYELFDNADRRLLNQTSQKILGQNLWETDQDYFSEEKLSFANALSRAEKKLYFSRTPVNEKGVYFGISHFLKRILEKCNNFHRLPKANVPQKQIYWDNPNIFEMHKPAEEIYESSLVYNVHKRKTSVNIKKAYEYIALIKQANEEFSKEIRPSQEMTRYFGELASPIKKFTQQEISISPTGLEKLGRCRYQGLWQGIFKLQAHKIPVYRPEAADYGLLYHHVLEYYIKETKDRNDTEFYDEILLHKILSEYIKQSSQEKVFHLDYNFLFTILRLFLTEIEVQFREDQKALFLELESGKGELEKNIISLSSEKRLQIFSRIDRINYDNINQSYHIIDYKKGSATSYESYQKTPFSLFQGFLYGALLQENGKVPVASISYIFLEKQVVFKELPSKGRKPAFTTMHELFDFKSKEIIQLLSLLESGNFSPFTLEEDIGAELSEEFTLKFNKLTPESDLKCSYCELKNICLRTSKKTGYK